MNVENAVGEGGDEIRAEDAHEAGEHHQPRLEARDQRRQRGVITWPIRKLAWRQRARWNFHPGGGRQACRFGLVADDSANFYRELAVGRQLGDRAHVAAATRDQDDDRQSANGCGRHPDVIYE
jgi:hypothetical protein